MDDHITRYLVTVAAAALFSLSSGVIHAQQSETAERQTASIISRDVIVQRDDTLRTIARRELGSSSYAPLLAEFNEISESAVLSIGQIIRLPIHVPARNEAADVVFVKGTVTSIKGTVTSNAQAMPLARGDRVELGDIISTGIDGFISIEFSTGSVVNLQPDTRAVITRLNCLPNDDSCLIDLDIEHGTIGSNVESRDGQPVEFKVNTPYASAAVRGTDFDFSADSETMTVGVTEGNVVISAQDQEVELDEGFGSLTQEGEAPGQPIELLPAPVYRYVPTRVAPGDNVTWWDIQGVSSYAALLSSDSAARQTVADFTASDARLEPASVPAGDYYLTIRGVDENGLQGFTSNTRLTIAEIDNALPAVTTTIEKQGNEYLIQVIEPPADALGFEIQIASDESFSDPLSVDVNNRGNAIFRIDQDIIFARARILQSPTTVSAFGEATVSE